jgi:hypothetical protein
MATSNDCVVLTKQIMDLVESARLVELDLLEQAINLGWDMNKYKLYRLEKLTGEKVGSATKVDFNG